MLELTKGELAELLHEQYEVELPPQLECGTITFGPDDFFDNADKVVNAYIEGRLIPNDPYDAEWVVSAFLKWLHKDSVIEETSVLITPGG